MLLPCKKFKIGSGLNTYNLGTGRGYSVLEMVTTFSRVNKLKIDYKIVDRREGDIGNCYSDPTKANTELNWYATKGLEDICKDAWNWQSKNPNGYKS